LAQISALHRYGSTGDAGPRLHRQFPYKATNSYQQNAPAPHCFEDALSVLLVMRVVRHPAVRPKIDLHREPGTLDRAVQIAKIDVDQPCAGRLRLTLRLTRRRRQQRRDLIPRARPSAAAPL
jgi:hypothetical protein